MLFWEHKFERLNYIGAEKTIWTNTQQRILYCERSHFWIQKDQVGRYHKICCSG